MPIPFTNGPPMRGQRTFRAGTFTSTWLAETDTSLRSSRRASILLIPASKLGLHGRSQTPDVGTFSPELTASVDNPAPVEKAVAVAARVQLGYDLQGAGNGPDHGNSRGRAWDHGKGRARCVLQQA